MITFFRSLRYLPRYRRLAAVLTRHGLGWLVDQLGLARFLAWPGRLLRRRPPPLPAPSLTGRLCRALEELGPSYVLLGRYLGTRTDLLPPDLCRELRCLPRGGAALPSAEAAALVEEALGQPLAQLFAEFSPQPWHCDWLEQVHQARTPAGKEAWVWLPHPAVRAQLQQDLPLFYELARLVDEGAAPGRRDQAVSLWSDFRQSLQQEQDVIERGHNAGRWRRSFAGRDGPDWPEVDWQRTGGGVLTCRACPGRPLDRAVPGPTPPEELARSLYRFFGQAIWEDGFYPAPLALEGWVVQDDGRLALTALAPVGYLDAVTRRILWDLLERLQAEDLDGVLEGCAALGLVERREMASGAVQAVRHLAERYRDLPPDELRLGQMAQDLYLAGRGALELPEELGLLLRTLVAVEDLGQQLAPTVSAAAEMAPALRRAMAARHSWPSRGERLQRAGRAWLEALHAFPVDAGRLLSQATQGDIQLGIEPRGWRRPMRRLERMVYRLVLSLVAAGLLIGLALLVTVLLPPAWSAWGWLLAGGALAVLVGLGFLLLLSLLRRE